MCSSATAETAASRLGSSPRARPAYSSVSDPSGFSTAFTQMRLRGTNKMHVERRVALDVAERDGAETVRELHGLPRLQLERLGLRSGAGELGHLVGVQTVDRLRDATVDAEVSSVDVEAQERVVQSGEGRRQCSRRRLALADRGIEEADHPDLLAQPVGDLHPAERREPRVLRDERHGVAEDDLALRILHRDRRRVPVAEEVDVGAADRERVVDLDGRRTRGVSRPGRRHLGGVVERCSHGIRVLGLVGDVEAVDPDRERLERAVGEEPARVERVVRREAVHEALPDDHDLLPGVAEASADADGDQNTEERDVEHQVAGLAQIAALGRDRRGPRVLIESDAIARAAEDVAGGLDRVRRVVAQLGRQDPRLEAGHPGQSDRCLGRPRPESLGVVRGARDDAADQRGEQQQVDGREPERRVHVEQLELVEHRSKLRVVVEVLGDAAGVGPALREERTGYGRDREQQQQEQGRLHARELAPRPAQPAQRSELGLGDVRVFARRRRLDVVRWPGQSRRSPPGTGTSWRSRDRSPSGCR